MEPKIAPAKATGGGGFVFEDKVAAHFICCLLRNRLPFEPEAGTLSRVDFQVRSDGWLLDDLLLTLDYGQVRRRAAVSVKSGEQITRNGFGADFVRLIWQQYLSNSPFDRRSDLLVLVTASGSSDLKRAVSNLLIWAREQDPRDLSERLTKKGFASNIERSLFNSFGCPANLLQDSRVGPADTAGVLRSVRVLFFDYESDPSEQLQSDIQLCSEILRSGAVDEAYSLWQSICYVSSQFRPHAGGLDLSRILGSVRSSFQLKEFPAYDADWARLRADTIRTLNSIRSTIGGHIEFDRQSEEDSLEHHITAHPVCVVVGPSGCGKSVIVKKWSEKKSAMHTLIFWTANALKSERFSPDGMGSTRFSYALDEIIPTTTSEPAYFVIDGLDHLSEEREFANLVEVSRWLRLEDPSSPWKFILTCQREEWNRVQLALVRFGGSVSRPFQVSVDHPETKQLAAVWEAFTPLQRLLSEKHLHHVLLNPRILDLFAANIAAGKVPDVVDWVGESDLIEWFWAAEVNKGSYGPARSLLLQKLGEEQADTMQYETALRRFSGDDLRILEALRKDGICKYEYEKIAFDHDLFGDWSRQRALLSHSHHISEFLPPKLMSPPWRRAVRLFGLHLLELRKDRRGWLNILNELSQSGTELGANLLLEAIIFAGSPAQILESLWDELSENNGQLLWRFLGQFLQAATFPDPTTLFLTANEEPEIRLRFAAKYRIPILSLWPPVLTFLGNHKTEVVKLVPSRAGRICDMWLRFSPRDSEARSSAADLALTGAEEWLGYSMSSWTVAASEELTESFYRAVIAAYAESPERSRDFILTACGKKPLEGNIAERMEWYISQLDDRKRQREESANEHRRREMVFVETGEAFPAEPLEPWPEGPQYQVDATFREICLKPDALLPLIASAPDVAVETILALLIEERDIRQELRRMGEYTHDFNIICGLNPHVHSFPPFYTDGPFLKFLTFWPNEGLDALIRLVNHATERWSERTGSKLDDVESVSMQVSEGFQIFKGDERVFYWFRESPTAPDVIAAALMALERWLYNRLETKEPIDEFVEFILKKSTSVALLGVLCEVGKKRPLLFTRQLLPLLSVPEFYEWTRRHNVGGEDYTMIRWTPFSRAPREIELAKAWHFMPHRQVDLVLLAHRIFLLSPETHDFCRRIRVEWKYRLDRGDFNPRLGDLVEDLIAQFDPDDWHLSKDSEGRQIWQYQPPEHIRSKVEDRFDEVSEALALSMFPWRCRRILDAQEHLRPEEMEQFWDRLENMQEMTSGEDSLSAGSKQDSICGGASALLKCYRNWLHEFPDRENWCREQIINMILRRQESGSHFVDPFKIVNLSSEGFSAEVVPHLWAEDLSSPRIRECIAILASSNNYDIVEILMNSASQIRHRLGRDFHRLQHFIMKIAVAGKRYSLGQQGELLPVDVKSIVLQDWNAFVKCSLEPSVPSWTKLKKRKTMTEKIMGRFSTKQSSQSARLNEDLVRAAYSWLPILDQAVHDEERQEWLLFWRQGLDHTIAGISKRFKQRHPSLGTPSPWDRWLLDRLPGIICSMSTEEDPATMWRPILELGAEAHYWINHFLTSWFLKYFDPGLPEQTFLKQWGAMIDYAFSSPGWNFERNRKWHDLEDLWCCLMGFEGGLVTLWSEDQDSIVVKMAEFYEQWAQRHLEHAECFACFAAFLRQPAAARLLLDGLIQLDRAIHARAALLSDERVVAKLASLLAKISQKHFPEIKLQPEAFAAFQRLISLLAGIQNPVAMEIQMRLGMAVASNKGN